MDSCSTTEESVELVDSVKISLSHKASLSGTNIYEQIELLVRALWRKTFFTLVTEH